MAANYYSDSERTKRELKTKMFELTMLNNTLIESIEKEASEVTIDTIKDLIQEKEIEINTLKHMVELKANEEEKKETKVEYSFYDGIEKPKLAKSEKHAKVCSIKKAIKDVEKALDDVNKLKDSYKSFYDGIDKIKKGANEVSLSDYKPYDTPYNKLNYENLYNSEPEEINVDYSSIGNASKFIVKFNGIDIKGWLVKRVDYACSEQLSITVQDHIASGRPIIADIRSMFGNKDSKFSLVIEHLNNSGELLYRERFHDCAITDVMRSSLDYMISDYSSITMLIDFGEVTYETNH